MDNKLIQEFVDAVEELLDCPYSVDEATIPKAGVMAAPGQVIMEYSISFLRIRKLRRLIKKIRSK